MPLTVRPRSLGRVRVALKASAALLAALALLFVAALFAADRGLLDRPIASWASSKLGRTVRFAYFQTHLLSSEPSLAVAGLTISGPAWAGGQPMAEIEHLDATLRLLPLLAGRLVVPKLLLQGVSLKLLRLKSGRNNWTFKAGGRSQAEFEPLRHTRTLTISNAALNFVDHQRDMHFEGSFEHRGTASAPFALDGIARLAGVPLEVHARGGPLNGQHIGDPYPFTATLIDGATRVDAHGDSGQPFDFRKFSVAIAASGPNLADLGYLFNLRLPNSAPFALHTIAKGNAPYFVFDHLSGQLGASDIAGWGRADHSSSVHKGTAALWSQVWTKADVDAALATVPPHAVARSSSGAVSKVPASYWMLSDAPFPIQNLRGVDLGVDLHIGKLQGYSVSLEHLNTRVQLNNGRLTYSSIRAQLYGGSLTGTARLDVHMLPPRLSVAGKLHDVQLGQLPNAGVSGVVDADVDMQGSGSSIHAAAALSSGKASFHLHSGQLPAVAGLMVGGDMLRAIGSLGDTRKRMPLDCASAQFAATSGRLLTTSIAMITPSGTTAGTGWIDLSTEQLHIVLSGAPVHRRLFQVSMPVLLQGRLAQPSVTLLPSGKARAIGLGGKLGVALSPVAELIPMRRDYLPAVRCR